MEKITFNYSTKNIATVSREFYEKCMLEQMEKLFKNMRWKAFFSLNPKKKSTDKETYGFRSKKHPPAIDEMATFESRMTTLIQNIEYTERINEFQQRISADIKNATRDNKMIIKADKTTNFYKVEKK